MTRAEYILEKIAALGTNVQIAAFLKGDKSLFKDTKHAFGLIESALNNETATVFNAKKLGLAGSGDIDRKALMRIHKDLRKQLGIMEVEKGLGSGNSYDRSLATAQTSGVLPHAERMSAKKLKDARTEVSDYQTLRNAAGLKNDNRASSNTIKAYDKLLGTNVTTPKTKGVSTPLIEEEKKFDSNSLDPVVEHLKKYKYLYGAGTAAAAGGYLLGKD